MLEPKIVLEEPPKSSLKKSVKFYRRLELNGQTRLDIAYQAMNACWGQITKLSERYQVSRKFIYEQQNQLGHYVDALERSVAPLQKSLRFALSLILQLR